jgi:endoglucanase
MKATSALLAPLIAGASATIYYAGVAESGGEFGAYGTPGTGLPGVFGTDYQFINTAGVDTHVDQNHLNLFRIAFLLERMCPLATGLGATFDEAHFAHYKEAVDYVTVTKGAYAILDPHNYMRYNDPSAQPFSGSVIGNTSDPTAATTAQFGAFWGELARRFRDNEKVIFGLMNEPHDMASSLVLANNQAAIDAIRAAGATNLILMPGNSWTGGHSWTQGDDPSSAVMNKFKDPANNTAIDIHEYLDVDYSGQHSECVNDAATNLADLTAWLKVRTQVPFLYSSSLLPSSYYVPTAINKPLTAKLDQQPQSLHNRVRRSEQHGLCDDARGHGQLHGVQRRVHRVDGVGGGAILGTEQPVLHGYTTVGESRARQHRRRRYPRPVRHRLATRLPAAHPRESAA